MRGERERESKQRHLRCAGDPMPPGEDPTTRCLEADEFVRLVNGADQSCLAIRVVAGQAVGEILAVERGRGHERIVRKIAVAVNTPRLWEWENDQRGRPSNLHGSGGSNLAELRDPASWIVDPDVPGQQRSRRSIHRRPRVAVQDSAAGLLVAPRCLGERGVGVVGLSLVEQEKELASAGTASIRGRFGPLRWAKQTQSSQSEGRRVSGACAPGALLLCLWCSSG